MRIVLPVLSFLVLTLTVKPPHTKCTLLVILKQIKQLVLTLAPLNSLAQSIFQSHRVVNKADVNDKSFNERCIDEQTCNYNCSHNFTRPETFTIPVYSHGNAKQSIDMIALKHLQPGS